MTVQAQTTTFQRSAEERGSWPTGRATGLALLPLLAFAAVALAIDGRKELGLPSSQVVWSVLVPLALAYPIVAAIARVNAYAPTTVLVTAAIAPAFAVAGRLLTEPIARDAAGRAIIDSTVLWERAMPPAAVATVMFLAIEIASAGIRRGIVLGIAASLVAVVLVGGAGVALFSATGTPIHPPA
ncbi:MAG TPA: hypothetical protein VFJ71_05120 [Candidatus Limnocylindrales bacterium]|nr:hypothetical protein [Candidatus Limnocylindrales bacterium]